MLNSAALFAVAVFIFGFVSVRVEAETNLCQIADQALISASAISGLRKKRKVPCLVQSKEQVKGYMLETIDQKVTPAKIANEEMIYRALGFIPESYSYQDGLVELYLGQIAGYYDPDKNHFVMAGWMPPIMQGTIAVHEQTHALQDQYYSLEKFADMKALPSDQLVARSALMEGEAVAVQTDYSRKLMGQKPLVEIEDVQSLLLQSIMSISLVSSMKTAPGSLVKMMIFPYTSGLRFAHTLLKKGGYPLLNSAFERPPRSTEEILHPEKYFKKQADFREISETEVLNVCGFNPEEDIYSDIFGEFAISALLSMYDIAGNRAAEVAAGWGGDRVVLVKPEANTSQIGWLIHWDSQSDARDFQKTFLAALAKKYGKSGLTQVGGEWTRLSSGKKIRFIFNGLDTSVCLMISGRPSG